MQTVDMAMAKACKLGLTLSRETKFTGPCATDRISKPIIKFNRVNQHNPIIFHEKSAYVTCTSLANDKSSYQPELQKGRTRQLPRK